MHDKDKHFGGSLLLDFRVWWRHVKTMYRLNSLKGNRVVALYIHFILPLPLIYYHHSKIGVELLNGSSFKIEQFSIECRKTKTKVIRTANQNKDKYHNELMRTQSK